jgi:hypothetical protein
VTDRDNTPGLIARFFGTLGGLLLGGLIGALAVILAIVFTGSTFGLKNIWPGAAASAAIGAVLGCMWPRRGIEAFDRFLEMASRVRW